MITTSLQFQAALNASHQMVTGVEVTFNGILQQVDLAVTDGEVTISNELIRRSANITVVDPTGALTPAATNDLIMPLGTEITLYRGIKFPDNTIETVRLGIFGIDDVQIEDSGANMSLRIDLFDRAKKVQRADFTSDYTIPSGTNYVDAIRNILIDGFPQIQINFPVLTDTTPNIIFQHNTDRWKAAVDMATDIGYDLFFDNNGVCIMRFALRPVWPIALFTEGETGNLLDIRKRYNRDGIYSHVIVSGETTDNTVPVRAEAVDNDPQSPTYYLGPFGDVPYFYTSQLITTTQQAQATALGLLSRVSGILEGLEFNALPNPALDVSDIINVKRALSKVDANYGVEKISLPLTQDRAMFVTCRSRSLALEPINS